jgi:membrane fusion protein, multidrug efflux system
LQANAQNVDAQMTVQRAQIGANQSQVDLAQAALVFGQQQERRYRALAEEGGGTVQSARENLSQLKQREASVQTAFENLNPAQRRVDSLKAQRMAAEGSLARAEAQVRSSATRFSGRRIHHRVPNAGHALPQQAPKVFADAVMEVTKSA